MFDLTLSTIQNHYPLAGSFNVDDFEKFEANIATSEPMRYLFNLQEIEKQYGTWEEFLKQYIAPNGGFATPFRKLISALALRTGVPVFDVIVSKGGLFVTEGDGVTPASQVRVERLLAHLERDIDMLTADIWRSLLYIARQGAPESTCVRTREYMRGCVSSLPMSLPANREHIPTLYFFEHYEELLQCEAELTTRYLSQGVYDTLCRYNQNPYRQAATDKPANSLIVSIAQYFIIAQYRPERMEWYLESAVEYIRYILQKHADLLGYDRDADPAGVFANRLAPDTNNFIA